MAADTEVVFPAKARNLFDGGLNNKYPRSVIDNNESPDCLNVVFGNGAVETRGGVTKLNTTSVGTFAIDSIYTRHDYTGAETMVVFAGGTMWSLGGTSTFSTIASAQSVFTAGVQVGVAEAENKMFIGNGGVQPYKYDGTNFTLHGVPAPVSAATVASNGTGLITGALKLNYVVTYVNSAAVEGNYGPVSATFTVSATAGQVTVSGIPVAPQSYGIASRYIYRANTTTGPWLRAGTIADNVTTSFTDNVSTTSLTITAPSDNGVPPVYSVIQQHQSRLFCNDAANPNLIYYSELAEPYTFGSTNFLTVGDKSLDIVKGLAVYQNGILVLGGNGLYLISMPSTNPTDWVTIKLLSQYGSKSPFATFLFDNKLNIAAVQNTKFAGFAAVTAGSLDPQQTYLEGTVAGSDRTSDRIEPDIFAMSEAHVGLISAIVYKNKAYITVPYGTSQATNNRVYVFDFAKTTLSKKSPYAWSPLSGMTASQFTIYNSKLYFGDSAATGSVYQLDTTSYNDDGSAINSYFWTKEFSGIPGHENVQKDFRRVKILVEMSGAYYMTLSYRTDSDKGAGNSKQVYLDSGASTWNGFNWGSANFGGGVDQQEITLTLDQTTGKRIQFKFSNQNTANQKFKVHGLNFTYNVKGRR